MESEPPGGPHFPDSPRGPFRALLAKVRQTAKPWLKWPANWDELRSSEEQKVLRAYLTSPEIQRERLEEVRQKFLSTVRQKSWAVDGSAAFLEGGTSDEWALYSSDCNKAPFRQEAFFQHLIGVNEPDLLAVIIFKTGELLLFLPRGSSEALRFMGPSRGADFYRTRYGVKDAIEFTDLDEVEADLQVLGLDDS